jgi:glc operon protein GlcG
MATTRLVLLIAILSFASTASAQELKFGTKPVITLAIAKQLAAAVLKASCKVAPAPGERPIVKDGVQGDCIGSVAIADDTGTVFYVETLDGTQGPSITMAIEKARTAALWKRSTKAFHDKIQDGTNLSYLDGSFPLTTAIGGEPLYLGNDCVGGIGFSGQNPDNVMPAAMAEWNRIVEQASSN